MTLKKIISILILLLAATILYCTLFNVFIYQTSSIIEFLIFYIIIMAGPVSSISVWNYLHPVLQVLYPVSFLIFFFAMFKIFKLGTKIFLLWTTILIFIWCLTGFYALWINLVYSIT